MSDQVEHGVVGALDQLEQFIADRDPSHITTAAGMLWTALALHRSNNSAPGRIVTQSERDDNAIAVIREMAEAGRSYADVRNATGLTTQQIRRLTQMGGIQWPRGPRRKWARSDAERAIRESFADVGADPMRASDYEAWRDGHDDNQPTPPTLYRLLEVDNWGEACKAIGLSGAGRRRHWSDEELLAAVAARGAGSSTAYDAARGGDLDVPTSATIITRFGSWAEAQERAAGRT